MNDEDILSGLPDFIQFGTLMKATPVMEGGARIIYVEASKESRDQQGEIVLQKALKESSEVFTKFGVLDLDHKSMPSVARAYGIEHPEEWIVGQPIDVSFVGGTTVVKAQLRQGDSPLAARANAIWEGLTKVNPPDRYYASVGGAVLDREIRVDPKTGEKTPVITKTRWNNLALSLTPVHAGLNQASLTPIGTFSKSLNGFVMNKSLSAGYGTDAATLTGGSAMRIQSLDGGIASYFDFRDKLAGAIKSREARIQTPEGLTTYSISEFGLSQDEATEWVSRFLNDIKSRLKSRSFQ